MKKVFTVDQAIIFEPDPENLKKLIKNVRLYRDNLTIIPNGVFSKITQLSFNLKSRRVKFNIKFRKQQFCYCSMFRY